MGGIPRARTASARSLNRATISCGSNDGTAVSVEGLLEPAPWPTTCPLTASDDGGRVAPRVRAALERADVEGFAALFSPDVKWAPGQSHAVSQPPPGPRVDAKERAQGRRATVSEVEVHGNVLLVGLRLDAGGDRWQVMRVGEDGVNDIRGYDDRTSAQLAL